MTKEKNKEFGAYIHGLRILRQLTVRQVSKKSIELFPDNKKAQITNGHLVHMEKGNAPIPSPEKLLTLSKIYEENYQFMLFQAGILPTNPFKETESVTHETLRNSYFDSLTTKKKRCSLTTEEKLAAEKMLEAFVMITTRGPSK